MIEVEKKFQPTEEKLKSLLEHAEFLGEIINHDIYYDYNDFRLLKQDIRLRNRNGSFELKLGKSSGVAEEIEEEEKIKKYFNTSRPIQDFIKENLILVIDYKAKRRKYKKEEFTIDVDEMDFGYNLCEIELLVGKEEEIKDAEDKIINLAKEYSFEIKKLPSKRVEYLRLLKPEIYKEIYATHSRKN